MAKSFFDIIDHLAVKKTPWEKLDESERKMHQPYMMNRWLSMDESWTPIVAETQRYTCVLSPRLNYLFYRDILPKKKLWLKYTKPQGDLGKIPDALYQFIARKLQISEKEAAEYVEILLVADRIGELKEYIKGFGYTETETEKFFK